MTPYVSTEPVAESPEQKAVRLLKRTLEELQTVRALNHKDPAFVAWRDTTRELLERFLGPDSRYAKRFRNLDFRHPVYLIPDVDFGGGGGKPRNYISDEDMESFREDCETTDASLRAAIRHVEDFGVYVEQVKRAPAGRGRGRSGGVSQTFHAPVTMNQAIATDDALQKIGHLGNAAGASLKEISDLLQRSEDLTLRQVKEGLANIETLAEEIQKPEPNRNWKAVLACGQVVLDIASKATDLAQKLAPYTPAVVALVDKARHAL